MPTRARLTDRTGMAGVQVWGEDPHKCPCCPGTMKVVGTMIRRAEVEFFLRLHGLWEAIIALPPPPEPPFDVETMEPIEAPLHAIWRDDFEDFGPDRWTEIDSAWAAPELDLGDGRRLVLDRPDPFPEEEWAVSGVNLGTSRARIRNRPLDFRSEIERERNAMP